MNNLILPKELFVKCYQLAKGSQNKWKRKYLAKDITNGKYFLVLESIEIGLTTLKTIHASFKLRIIIWFIITLFIIASLVFSKWFSLGIVIAFIIDRYIARLDKKYWIFLSALLLTCEMLMDNFAGWGNKFQKESSEVTDLYNRFSISNRTLWLDYYLKYRDNFSADIVSEFGPK